MTQNLQSRIIRTVLSPTSMATIVMACILTFFAQKSATAQTGSASEYSEWGLGRTTAETPQEEHGKVPAAIANHFERAAVLILVVMEDGKELLTAGWIVDRE